MRIQEAVAVEAIRVAKWVLAILVSVLATSVLLPDILPRITKANLGVVELELVESRLNDAVTVKGKDFKGLPKDILKVLNESGEKLRMASVLWIDNEPANNTPIRNLLEEAGVRFEVTASSDRAKELLDSRRYDLVISDSGRGEGKPTGEDFFTKYRQTVYPPPWFFYSATLGGRAVPGATLSTNNPYVLIPKLVETIRKRSGDGQHNHSAPRFVVPWWFYMAGILALLATLAFIVWIVRSSALGDRSHNKSIQPTADAAAD